MIQITASIPKTPSTATEKNSYFYQKNFLSPSFFLPFSRSSLTFKPSSFHFLVFCVYMFACISLNMIIFFIHFKDIFDIVLCNVSCLARTHMRYSIGTDEYCSALSLSYSLSRMPLYSYRWMYLKSSFHAYQLFISVVSCCAIILLHNCSSSFIFHSFIGISLAFIRKFHAFYPV